MTTNAEGTVGRKTTVHSPNLFLGVGWANARYVPAMCTPIAHGHATLRDGQNTLQAPSVFWGVAKW